MTPREFLEAVVRFDVAEFRDEYGNIRRAYHAVTAVDALAAHISYGAERMLRPRSLAWMMTLTIVANCPSARQIFGCCAILLRLKSTFISNEESRRSPRPRKWWPVRWDLAKEGLAKAGSAVRPKWWSRWTAGTFAMSSKS